jgi:RecA-family ATPase
VILAVFGDLPRRVSKRLPQGILFVGGEPKVGKSLLVANLALALAAGQDRVGFCVPTARRVPICQFELPVPQFVSRLAVMRHPIGAAADRNLLVDTRAAGHLLSAPQGLNHFLTAAHDASAEVIVLDPLYSTHDQDENDTRSMAALCQSLLRLRDTSKAALIVAHHAQVHRTRRDWPRFPRLFGAARRG